MLRRVLIGATVVGLAAAVAAPARAYYSQVLMPGVSYSRQVQFTAHGPVAIHVITAPKPVGLYRLRPLLANGTVTGRQRVTAMEKAVSDQATVVGTNGDLFNWADGHPSGIVMQDGLLKVPPLRSRSSIGISNTGTLTVQRVAQFGEPRRSGLSFTLDGAPRERLWYPDHPGTLRASPSAEWTTLHGYRLRVDHTGTHLAADDGQH